MKNRLILKIGRQMGQYQKPQQYNIYNKVDDHMGFFNSLPIEIVSTDPFELQNHNKDWTGNFIGSSRLLLKPKTTQQVSDILEYCNRNRLAVVPQSGNTGLVGGSVPVFDEIILSLKNMNRILETRSINKLVSVESGVILQELNEHLNKQGLECPYDLGSKGSCMIGGNISTQAAGSYMVRNNLLRGYVVGLEVVKANGEVLDMTSRIRKDNTGPDLKQLFIGSEGTLGIITKVDMVCVDMLRYRRVVMLRTDSFNKVLKILGQCQSGFGNTLVAFEYMDSQAYNTSKYLRIQPPFQYDDSSDYYILLEIGNQVDVDDLILEVVESLSDIVSDSLMSISDEQYNQLWSIRSNMASCCLSYGPNLKYDFSIDQEHNHEFVEQLRSRVGDQAKVVSYGHLGDGNIHVQVICRPDNHVQMQQLVEPWIFYQVQQLNGSISAEHGLGSMKGDFIGLGKSQQVVSHLKEFKKMLDPNHILNPYKVYGSDFY